MRCLRLFTSKIARKFPLLSACLFASIVVGTIGTIAYFAVLALDFCTQATAQSCWDFIFTPFLPEIADYLLLIASGPLAMFLIAETFLIFIYKPTLWLIQRKLAPSIWHHQLAAFFTMLIMCVFSYMNNQASANMPYMSFLICVNLTVYLTSLLHWKFLQPTKEDITL